MRTKMVGRVVLGGVLLAGATGFGQTGAATATQPAQMQATAAGGTIRGAVKAGNVPLPGVSVTATNTLTGKKYATSTDIRGEFAMKIPENGRYVVRAELAAFAPETREVVLHPAGAAAEAPQVADFSLQLASRVVAERQQAAQTTAGNIRRGLQALEVLGGDSDFADASTGSAANGAQMPSLGGFGSEDNATDSVAVNGQMGQTNRLADFSEDDLRERIQSVMDRARRQGGANGDMAGVVAGMIGGMLGPGGLGGPGGFRGRGGRFGGRGGFRGFSPTQPHGAIFYQGGNGALDAAPFSVAAALGEPGAQVVKPDSSTNRFGVTLTGSPMIPGLLKPSSKQFVFLSVVGQRNITPQVLTGTVPTEAERRGDFSQSIQVNGTTLPTTILNPVTGQPISTGALPISPQSQALLNYYPAPNVPNATNKNNYQTVTTAGSNAMRAAMRFVRNFGQNSGFGFGRGGFGRGGFGRRNLNAPASLRQNINFNGSYTHTAADNRNIFSMLGGSTETNGYGVTAGYSIGYGRFTNNASINWNRQRSQATNYFTNKSDPLNGTGINIPKPVVAVDPGFYYGVPNLNITSYTGLNEQTPSDTINQTISFSDFVSYREGKHNMRFGVDVRRVHDDSVGGTNVVGTYTFTGYATQAALAACKANAANAADCPTIDPTVTGFMDFLLGLPQQSAIQAGEQKIHLRANILDWYAQDDWRALPNLSLNYGIRYEYFSPYVEKDNRLVNLMHNADFSQVTPVCAAAVAGACEAGSPRSLVNPDRTMFSPRVAFAYRLRGRLFHETVLRGGYGINYNTGQYARFGQLLAFQTPFAITQTNNVSIAPSPLYPEGLTGTPGCTPTTLTLANGFGCSTAAVQNNYAVNPNYRLGRVQIWDVDLQRTLPLGIVLNLGYNGSKGGDLDIVRVPNRTASGQINPSIQPFNYEDSLGESRFNALTVNARKRMSRGVALSATYQYGHSIDDASSIGGTASANGVRGAGAVAGIPVPAQDDQNLKAEESNSSFDVRHRVTGSWVIEMPFGPNRLFLTKGGLWSKALDGFSFSGDFTFASGTYVTPNYSGTVQETASGVASALRPDRNFGTPIAGAGKIGSWFNTNAFAAPPSGQYGTASRNSIEGPGQVVVDASLSKTVDLGDTRSFEARVTAANAINSVQYTGIDTTLNSKTYGQVTSAAAMRTITVIARYRF